MKKTFLVYFFLLLYLELVFHIACFKSFNFFAILFILLFSLVFSVLLAFITSLFRQKSKNGIFLRIITILLVIVFGAELVYYKIYESIFTISGLVFIGAVKDGFDKVLRTILENIGYILLFILPIFIVFIKVPRRLGRINKRDCSILGILLFLSIGYSSILINFVNTADNYSYYNLFHNVNLPILNVKNFGLLTSSMISLERDIFGFTAKTLDSEDILINKRTILSNEIVVEYNDSKIDFDKLINDEADSNIVDIHRYFSEQEPTNKNDFTGMFKDKNVIFVMAESFDEIAIHEELTPTLYKLKNEGIKFNNYFSPKYPASTADGQYMLEWGLLPIIGEDYSLIDMVYNTNPYLLPRMLKNKGYSTYAYHNYVGYYNHRSSYFSTLNFDGVRYCNDGISTVCENFHASDIDLIDQSVGDYINQDKFFAYYITLSGHGSYDNSNFIATKNLHKLNGYNLPMNLKYYLAANIEFDLAMENLISSLEKAGKLDDTVIVISSDHSPYYLPDSQMNLLSNVERGNKFGENRGSLIIYNSQIGSSYNVDKYAMNIDVLPTLLNMLGLEYDSRLIIGKDIMATNNDGVVILPDRSWINSYGSYDSITGQFTSFVESVDSKYVNQITQEVNDKCQVSVNLQYSDYYKYVFK